MNAGNPNGRPNARGVAMPPEFRVIPGGHFDLQHLGSPPRGANEAAIRALCHNAYLGDGIAVTRILGRYKMFVDTGDISLATHLMMDGFWEMWTTEAMLQLVRPGAVCVDAGANLGYFSLMMAELAGPGGQVHAFEPNPRLAMLLGRTLDINGFGGRSRVHNLALADRAGTATFKVPLHEPMNGYVASADEVELDHERPDDRPMQRYTVPLMRFDSLGIVPDFIKIDVEGAEEALWRGLAGVLAARRPLTVLLEFVADRYADPERFLSDILRHGFALSRLTYDVGVVPWDLAAALATPGGQEQMLVMKR